jgi:hypothetical protein
MMSYHAYWPSFSHNSLFPKLVLDDMACEGRISALKQERG